MSATAATRAVAAFDATLGLALLAQPQLIDATAPASGRPPSIVVRAYGLRCAVQGTMMLTRPGAACLRAAAVTDLVHAMSMVLLRVWRPQYRRVATVSAAAAITTGCLTARLSRAGTT